MSSSTLSHVTMLYAAEASTLTGVRVFSPIAEALCRPSRCSILQEQVLCRASEYSIQLRKHSVGCQSTSANRASIVTADRVLYSNLSVQSYIITGLFPFFYRIKLHKLHRLYRVFKLFRKNKIPSSYFYVFFRNFSFSDITDIT